MIKKKVIFISILFSLFFSTYSFYSFSQSILPHMSNKLQKKTDYELSYLWILDGKDYGVLTNVRWLQEKMSVSTLNDNKDIGNINEIQNEQTQVDTVDFSDVKNEYYRRNSIYTLTLAKDRRPDFNVMNAFDRIKYSEKYDYINLGPYMIKYSQKDTDKLQVIREYLMKNQVAKGLVAKWFFRDWKGGFSTGVVANHGMYDASELDKAIASKNIRGEAILKDAGEELINKTFVIVFDSEYEFIFQPKKYKILCNPKLTAYVFRLNWSDDVANTFYTQHWMEKDKIDEQKKKAFEESDIFVMDYVGKTTYEGIEDVTRVEDSYLYWFTFQKYLAKKMENELFHQIEMDFPETRTRFPIYSENPIGAQVGKKEGIKAGDTFEVVEKVQLEDGTHDYERVGVVTVENEEDIWDNTAKTSWIGSSLNRKYTILKGEGEFYKGMLLRQIYPELKR